MRDEKLELRNLHASHALGCTTKQNGGGREKKRLVTVRHKKNCRGAQKEGDGEKLEEKREDWRK